MKTLHLESKKGDKNSTLVFVHGNSQNLHFWDNQLNSPFFNGFHCIALDLPGHGNSPKLENYQIPNLMTVLSNTINQFGQIVLIGHSLGGHIILQSLSKIKNCIGLVLIGTPPLKKPLNMNEAFSPDERMALLFKQQLSKKEREALLEFVGCNPNSSLAQDALEMTDAKFRSDISNSVAAGELVDELDVLKSIDFPVALVVGENDLLTNKDYVNTIGFPSLWKEQVQYIPGTGHTPQLKKPEVFNKLLSDFINGIGLK